MSEVIDHVGIRVSDLAASRRMYEAALGELGITMLGEGEFEGDAYVLLGHGTSDDFALHTVGTNPGRDRVTTGAHIAFRMPEAGGANASWSSMNRLTMPRARRPPPRRRGRASDRRG